MAQQSVRRGRKNQGFPQCLGHALGDLDPARELPYRPAATRVRIRGRTDGSIRLRAKTILKFSLTGRGRPQMESGHRYPGALPGRGRVPIVSCHLTLCSCKACQVGPDHEVMKGPDHVEIGEAEGIVGVHDGCRDELRAGWRIATEQR